MAGAMRLASPPTPTIAAIWTGLNLLFVNAVFRGPGHAGGGGGFGEERQER